MTEKDTTQESTQETAQETVEETKPKPKRRRSATRKKPAAKPKAKTEAKPSAEEPPAKEKPTRRTVASVIKDVFSRASVEVQKEISAACYQTGVNSLTELRQIEPELGQSIIRAAFYNDAVRAAKRREKGPAFDADTEAALRDLAERRNVNFDSLFTPNGLPELGEYLQEVAGNFDIYAVWAHLEGSK